MHIEDTLGMQKRSESFLRWIITTEANSQPSQLIVNGINLYEKIESYLMNKRKISTVSFAMESLLVGEPSLIFQFFHRIP